MLQGISTDGSTNQVANSANRRNGSLTMTVIDNTLYPQQNGSAIWFGNMVRISTGVEYLQSIVWFNLGIFMVKDVDFKYDKSGQIATFNLADLCSSIDGTLGGQLTNTTQIIAQSTNINQAISTTVTSLARLNISRLLVNGSQSLVPYDIIVQPNSTIYSLVNQLNSLYMGNELFFDENGYFVVQSIPDLINDPLAFDFTNIPTYHSIRKQNGLYSREKCYICVGSRNKRRSSNFRCLQKYILNSNKYTNASIDWNDRR